MDIARKFEFYAVCICRYAFRTPRFSCKINIKSNYMDFQKNAKKKMFHGLWQDISCIKFHEGSDFEALFNILDRCRLPLNEGLTWGV